MRTLLVLLVCVLHFLPLIPLPISPHSSPFLFVRSNASRFTLWVGCFYPFYPFCSFQPFHHHSFIVPISSPCTHKCVITNGVARRCVCRSALLDDSVRAKSTLCVWLEALSATFESVRRQERPLYPLHGTLVSLTVVLVQTYLSFTIRRPREMPSNEFALSVLNEAMDLIVDEIGNLDEQLYG